MSVIKFDPHQSNFMIHGDRRFFLISLDNSTFLVRDNCPHRGGPLHLGYFNCQNNAIVCPWHNSAVSVHRLQQLAMPLVWRNDVAIAVIPGAESTPIAFKHRYIMVYPEIGCNGG
ncbi:Rieske (2Fe-2S) protein [Nostoc sp.]|uniref:Rieske (2Fe-2S) protein n=1 Tax=Nostoc sp. TaxID=1180 RepID=UPI002FF48EF4